MYLYFIIMWDSVDGGWWRVTEVFVSRHRSKTGYLCWYLSILYMTSVHKYLILFPLHVSVWRQSPNNTTIQHYCLFTLLHFILLLFCWILYVSYFNLQTWTELWPHTANVHKHIHAHNNNSPRRLPEFAWRRDQLSLVEGGHSESRLHDGDELLVLHVAAQRFLSTTATPASQSVDVTAPPLTCPPL